MCFKSLVYIIQFVIIWNLYTKLIPNETTQTHSCSIFFKKMIIKDIKFTGFKHKDQTSGLDLSKIEAKSILSQRGENKNFLFKSLLGIIFGFSEEEKKYYRDSNSLVCTGLVDLKFENYILHIERDFETDIIAVLSENDKIKKAIYQGRDDYNKPANERPYLNVIKSFFSINDKTILLKACDEKLAQSKSTFGDLLDTFYLFLRPKFKKAVITNLIESCTKILENKNGSNQQPQISANLQKAVNRLYLLKHAKRIIQSKQSIVSDINKFENYIESTFKNQSSNAKETLKQRFPLIYSMDAYQVKKDITYIHALQRSNRKVQQQLQKLDDQKSNIENTINQSLMVYSNLPESFIEDFHIYQNLSIDLAQLHNEKDKKNILLGNHKEALESVKKKNLISQFFVYIFACTAGLFFYENIYWIGAGTLIISMFLAVMFSKIKKSKDLLIDICNHEILQLKTKIKQIDNNISELRKKSYLLDDLEYIDTHIERFKKYKQLKKQIKIIDQEKNDLLSQLNNDKFKIILPRLEQQYKDLINLNPPEGLEVYLEEFKTLQNTVNEHTSGNEDQLKNTEALKNIIADYKYLIKNLDVIRAEIEDYLGIDKLENDIDSQISYLERAITHLKQKIPLGKNS